MLKREAIKQLEDWIHNKLFYAAILLGARQVGKTYLVREFANTYFKDKHIYIDLMKDEQIKQKLKDVKDPQIIINILNVTYSVNIKNDWLIIFDELQELKSIRTSFKFFNQEKRCLVIGLGRYLSNSIFNDNEGFPVRQVEIINIYPLTFKEYMNNITSNDFLVEAIKELRLNNQYHKLILEQWELFVYLGGLPNVINQYLINKDFVEVNNIKKWLYAGYVEDISKLIDNNTDKSKALLIFDNIGHFLAKENNGFCLSVIDKNARYRDYENALLYLLKTKLLYKQTCLKTYHNYFVLNQIISKFKLFYFDVGFISYLLNIDYYTMFHSEDKTIMTFKGSIGENFINNELIAKWKYEIKSYFYKFIYDGKSYEIDFLLNDTKMNVIPVEVKTNDVFKARSLMKFIDLNQDITKAIIFSYKEISIEQYKQCKIYYLPIYLISWLEFENDKINLDRIDEILESNLDY